MVSHDSSRNQVAAISYVLGFVTGIVILMVEKDDRFIRFHAMQSTLSTGSLFILNIILGIVLTPLGVFSFISTLTGIIIWLAIFYLCVRSFIEAYRGNVYKLPVFGNIAEKRVR
jgi:uncharacterized membrane protein